MTYVRDLEMVLLGETWVSAAEGLGEGDSEALALDTTDGLTEALGLADADGLSEAEGLSEADAEAEGLSEAEGEREALPAIEGLAEADGDSEADAEAPRNGHESPYGAERNKQHA